MAEIRVKETGTIKLFESDNTSSVTIASPASLGADRTITLPDASVTLASGTMLATDGSGASLTALNASELGSGTVPTARLGSGTASSSVFLAGDNTWAAAGEANQPYFWAYATATQSGVSAATWTVVDYPSEYYDSASAYDTSTMKFTPQTAGIYLIGGMAETVPDADVTQLMVAINKNAAGDPIYAPHLALGSANLHRWNSNITGLIHFNGSSDYVQMMVHISGQDGYIMGHNGYTNFWGFLVST
jgi:hypothetical protein